MSIAHLIFTILSQWMPCEHAEIATKQAILETGWFKSYAYTEYHNAFGLMWEGKIQKFDTVEESCYQYYRQVYCQYEGGDYYDFLIELPYAGDPGYTDKLDQIHF